MNTLKINKSEIQKIKESDSLFGDSLEKIFLGFTTGLKKTPILYKTIMDSLSDGDEYIARLSKETVEKINSGEFERVINNKSGLWNGMVRNSNGRKEIVKQTNWEQINISKEMISNLNQLSIQLSLAEISDKLNSIENKVEALLQGQNSDRIALIKSGIDIYEMVPFLLDQQNKSQHLTNAYQNISVGKEQLKREIEGFFKLKKSEPIFFDKIWNLFGVDHQNVKLGNEVQKKKDDLLESLQYICIAYAYEIKILSLQEEKEAVTKKKNELLKFIEKYLEYDTQLLKFFPHEIKKELIDTKNSFKQLGHSISHDQEILIEFTSEDLNE